MKSLHLFAGAGGGLLSDLILGHEPVAAVEWDPYCCQVLRERAAEGWFPNLQVFEGDVRVFNASDWKGRVDLIHAGFPCPPFSVAGKRLGADDPRNMWPATARIIGEVRPEWVFLENVGGFVSSQYGWTVLSDLSRLGYDARWMCLGADQVGAPHRRDRWWLLANANSGGGGSEFGEQQEERAKVFDPGGAGDVANARRADCKARGGNGVGDCQQDGTSPCSCGNEPRGRRTRSGWERSTDDRGRETPRPVGLLVDGVASDLGRPSWWEVEPEIGRVTKSEENRVKKLKALGNGQVPLQAASAFRILMEGFEK